MRMRATREAGELFRPPFLLLVRTHGTRFVDFFIDIAFIRMRAQMSLVAKEMRNNGT